MVFDTLLATADARAEASNVFGWLSIGCWLIVYTPQIYENYTRRSGEGLSITFVVTWLLGDLFSFAGAILAGLIPTVILLALYYALCDMTLLFQIYYYRIFYSSRDQLDVPSEREPLLGDPSHSSHPSESAPSSTIPSSKPATSPPKHLSNYQLIVEYTLLWCFVFAFGFGAFLYDRHTVRPTPQPDVPDSGKDVFEWKSQVMGWMSALLYLGSRIPQIQKNVETRCEGLSLALFMFAIAGNTFYVLSICILSMEWHHFATNASWLAGSGLTVFLDFFVLGQFFHYRRQDQRRLRLEQETVQS